VISYDKENKLFSYTTETMDMIMLIYYTLVQLTYTGLL